MSGLKTHCHRLLRLLYGTSHAGVANYTLELKYSDGRVKRTSIFFEPGASKAGVREFYLNTYKFARVR